MREYSLQVKIYKTCLHFSPYRLFIPVKMRSVLECKNTMSCNGTSFNGTTLHLTISHQHTKHGVCCVKMACLSIRCFDLNDGNWCRQYSSTDDRDMCFMYSSVFSALDSGLFELQYYGH